MTHIALLHAARDWDARPAGCGAGAAAAYLGRFCVCGMLAQQMLTSDSDGLFPRNAGLSPVPVNAVPSVSSNQAHMPGESVLQQVLLLLTHSVAVRRHAAWATRLLLSWLQRCCHKVHIPCSSTDFLS